ncbi:MAG: Smr/MutS family protein [Deltaproteobacteria bacterium]|nr:Smr/MutS family protein [Deltaproteobacteria bacterium]
MSQEPDTPKPDEAGPEGPTPSFADALRDDREGVVPLDPAKAGRVAPRAPRAVAPRNSAEAPRFRVTRDDDWVEVLREGEPEDLVAALGRDDVRVSAELDLHGRGTGPAVVAVERFAREQARRGLRTVRIVTGKGLHSEGAPVIRDAVVEALTQGPISWLVLAVRTAPAAIGGSGALLVTVRPSS